MVMELLMACFTKITHFTSLSVVSVYAVTFTGMPSMHFGFFEKTNPKLHQDQIIRLDSKLKLVSKTIFASKLISYQRNVW